MKDEIGKRIMGLRKLNHYTREELAEKAGVSSKFLYEIEMGRKSFSANVLCRLADSLSVSCDYIMLRDKQYSLKECYVDVDDKKQKLENLDLIIRVLSILYDVKIKVDDA